eukprot:1188790-Prorocentrum_minimum.AAC.1
MDVEETMKRINSHKGVLGIIIVNNDGIPIRTTLDAQVTVQYAALVTHLASKARSVVRKLDEQNDLHFLRIRSKKHEIMERRRLTERRRLYFSNGRARGETWVRVTGSSWFPLTDASIDHVPSTLGLPPLPSRQTFDF